MDKQKDELEIFDDLHLAQLCAEVPPTAETSMVLREPELPAFASLGERAIIMFQRHKVLTAVGTTALGVAVGGTAARLRHH